MQLRRSPAIYQRQESEIWFLLHFVMELDFKCDLLWGGNGVLTSFAMQHLISSAHIRGFYRTPSTLPPHCNWFYILRRDSRSVNQILIKRKATHSCLYSIRLNLHPLASH